jgi:hypothetical protein
MRLMELEWLGLWCARGMRWVIVAAVGVMVLIAGVYALVPVEGEVPTVSSAVEGTGFWGLILACVVLVAAVSRGRAGITASAVLAEPNRHVLLKARLGLALVIALGTIVLATMLGSLAVMVMAGRGVEVAFDWVDLPPLVLSLLVSTLLAVACGLLLPSPGIAYGVFILVSLFGDLLVSRLGSVGQLLSVNQIADYWSRAPGADSTLLGVLLAAMVWILVPLTFGAWLFLRGDIKVTD